VIKTIGGKTFGADPLDCHCCRRRKAGSKIRCHAALDLITYAVNSMWRLVVRVIDHQARRTRRVYMRTRSSARLVAKGCRYSAESGGDNEDEGWKR
jgi:hypothetical protein